MLSLASGRGTSNPLLSAIYRARRINQWSGGTLVAPWNVDELTEDWQEAFLALDTELPAMQSGMSKVEARKQQIRASHPAYKKH